MPEPLLVLHTGAAYEPWTPADMERKAVAGSEISAVRMAGEFARRGFRTVVFAPCDGGMEVHSGVEFLDVSHFPRFAEQHDIDVFIAMRYVRLLEQPMRARRRFLWLTDVCALGTELGANDAVRRMYGEIDAIVCQSPAHVEEVVKWHAIGREKIAVIELGVDAARFARPIDRHRHRFAFASCPDRGLDTLIDLFPLIRRRVADAELHVFYGFELWDHRIARSGNAEERHARLRLEARCRQPGVFLHGHVGQERIAEEFLRSDVWFYPTRFVETYCLTALEAQMGGAVCVCSDLGSLRTTVGDRGILLEGDAYSENYRRRALAEVFALLEDPERRCLLRDRARRWARLQTWERCGESWMRLFEASRPPR